MKAALWRKGLMVETGPGDGSRFPALKGKRTTRLDNGRTTDMVAFPRPRAGGPAKGGLRIARFG